MAKSAISLAGDNATTKFVESITRHDGSAIHVSTEARVSLAGDTGVTSITPRHGDRGVVATNAVDLGSGTDDSLIAVSGTKAFLNNTAGGNSGGSFVLVACTFNTGTAIVSFVGNPTAIRGSAVFLSGTGFGPTSTGTGPSLELG